MSKGIAVTLLAPTNFFMSQDQTDCRYVYHNQAEFELYFTFSSYSQSYSIPAFALLVNVYHSLWKHLGILGISLHSFADKLPGQSRTVLRNDQYFSKI